MQAMSMGLKEMKKEYKNIDLNKIENLQDDMADILEQVNEVQDNPEVLEHWLLFVHDWPTVNSWA